MPLNGGTGRTGGQASSSEGGASPQSAKIVFGSTARLKGLLDLLRAPIGVLFRSSAPRKSAPANP